MTSDEDRKQTKYGHKRWEHMTHTRQRTDSAHVELQNTFASVKVGHG